ncbi:MAG: rod shape-determining protein RodA, partial [Desulfobacteraceae bacterium]
MIDRRLVENFDWWMLALTVFAGMVGLIALYSAVNAGADIHPGLFTKQLIWYAGGMVVMIAVFLVDFKVYERWGHLYYVFCLGLLVAVQLFGKYVGGSKRWLVLGPVSIQPSEMVKLAIIIMLAKYY